MCRLYEKFILEYYRKHYSGIKANPSQIPWQLDDGISDMLPVMQTDIMLSQGDRVLIIDAKYYSHTTQQQFGIRDGWVTAFCTFSRFFATFTHRYTALSHERNLFCLPRQERFFHAFRGKTALNIGKYRWNRGWNGRSDCTSPCLLLFGGQTGAILFAFLCSAKKLAKQHPTGFEYF